MGINLKAAVSYIERLGAKCIRQTKPTSLQGVIPTEFKLVTLSDDVAQISKKGVGYYKSLITDDLISNLPSFNHSVNIVNLEIDRQIVTGRLLGGGGTKTAYEIVRNGRKEVICLPNKVGNWKKVLDEVKNTEDIKKIGLLANDMCEVQPIVLNGYTFPAIKMKPFSEHNFKIFDSKNAASSTGKLEATINVKKLTVEKVEKLFDNVVDDINKLMKHNVVLHSDCFNMAQTQDGKLRLFINDIGELSGDSIHSKKMANLSADAKKEIAKRYIGYSIGAFCSGFCDSTFYSSKFLKDLSFRKGLDELVERLLPRINCK